MLFYQECELLN